MSGRCPVTGSCPFFVVRRVEMEESGRKKLSFNVLSGRNALESDCRSAHACQPAIFNALPRPPRCLALTIHCQLRLNQRNKNELPRNSKRSNGWDHRRMSQRRIVINQR
jgi:hypothetical protein